MTAHLILVFGISGVGKTQACKSFVQRNPEYLYFRASDLLSAATSTEVEELRTASADQILGNQSVLAKILKIKRQGQWEKPVLVDAHSVIYNDRELVKIPIDVIRQISPDGLILLEASPELVAERRAKDGRKRPLRSLSELDLEAKIARQAVSEYAAVLRLPLEVATVDDNFLIDGSLETITRRIESSID